MDYKLYKIHHSRGKSDTNFYQEQNILNGAYSSLKVLRISLVNELAYIPNKKKFKKSSKTLTVTNNINNTSKNDEEKEKKEDEEENKEKENIVRGKKILL